MVNCKQAANDTHKRYGTLAYTTQRMCGQTAMSAQMSVPTTSKMSKDARRLYFNPNCIGVKAKLKTRLSANGKATSHGICLVKAL